MGALPVCCPGPVVDGSVGAQQTASAFYCLSHNTTDIVPQSLRKALRLSDLANLRVINAASLMKLSRKPDFFNRLWDFATLVGPALAGILITFMSALAVLLLDAASFLLMGAITISLPQMQCVLIGQEEAENRRSLLG